MTDTDVAALLENDSFTIIPLVPADKGPLPANKGWRSLTSTPRIVDKNHLGIALRVGQLVVDVDPRNGGNESLEYIEMLTGVDFTQAQVVVKTNGDDGGMHYYFSIPDDLSFSLSHKEFPGVDFISHGRFVRAPGCLRTNGKRYEYLDGSDTLNTLATLTEAPSELIDFIQRFYEKRPDAPTVLNDNPGYSLETIADMLQTLDPTKYSEYEQWRDLLFSTHYACQGSAEGLELFTQWSIQDPQYRHDAQKIQSIWASASYEDGQGITDRTLLARYRENGGNPNTIIAQTQLEPLEIQKGDDLSYKETLDDWVYLADLSHFLSKRTCELDQIKQFNYRFLFAFEKGEPAKQVLRQNLVDKYHSKTYVPGIPKKEKIRLANGNLAYNVYLPPKITPKKGDVTPYLDHIAYMFPDPDDRIILYSFIAHLIQHPGDKIMWALIVQSDSQGIGKTEIIGRFLAYALGSHNINKPTTKDIRSQFNSWAENIQLIVIEELMALGRQEITNHLKTLITEENVIVNEKHVKTYRMPNIANYMAFTNHRDALKLEKGTRRYAVLTSSVKPREDEYYDTLIRWVKASNSKIYHYFLNYKYDISIIKGRAPKTQGCDMMVGESVSDLEFDINRMSDTNFFPFTNKVIDPIHVVDSLRGFQSTRKVIKALVSIGYIDTYRPRCNNKRPYLLTKAKMTADEKCEEYTSYQRAYSNSHNDIF